MQIAHSKTGSILVHERLDSRESNHKLEMGGACSTSTQDRDVKGSKILDKESDKRSHLEASGVALHQWKDATRRENSIRKQDKNNTVRKSLCLGEHTTHVTHSDKILLIICVQMFIRTNQFMNSAHKT
jgi:hypothetical protein